MRKTGIKTQRVRFSSKDLIEALKKAGVSCETFVIKETAADRRRHKDVEKFLKEEEEFQKRAEKCPIIFKENISYSI